MSKVLDLSNWHQLINPWCSVFYDNDLRNKYRYFVCKGGAGS